MNGNEEMYLVYSNAYRLNVDGHEPDKGSINNDTTFSDEINADKKKKLFIRSFFNDNFIKNIIKSWNKCRLRLMHNYR